MPDVIYSDVFLFSESILKMTLAAEAETLTIDHASIVLKLYHLTKNVVSKILFYTLQKYLYLSLGTAFFVER